MSDKLDKDLVNHIKEVFDNYDDASADEGWLLLRKKFPEQEKHQRGLVWLWWSAAAILLIGLSIGFWLLKQPAAQQYAAQTKHKAAPIPSIAAGSPKNGEAYTATPTTESKTVTAGKDSSAVATPRGIAPQTTGSSNIASVPVAHRRRHEVTGMQIAAVKPVLQPGNNNLATVQYANRRNSAYRSNGNSAKANSSVYSRNRAGKANNGLSNNAAVNSNNNALRNEALANNISPGSSNKASLTNNGGTPGQSNNARSQNTAGQEAVNNIPGKKANPPVDNVAAIAKTAVTPDADSARTSKAMEKLLASDRGSKTAKELAKQDKIQKNDKTVLFGLYAATYYNYAKGSDNQLNAGGGVSSDIKLGGRLRLSTGIAITQNSLSYQGSSYPETAIMAAQVKASTYYFATVSAKSASYVAAAQSIPSLQNYNASLVGLDVPVNLKFQFSSKRTDPYVSAGISSGTFINETYKYIYSSPYTPYALTNVQTQNQTTSRSFGSFDFARTLNFSFGMGTQLSKGSRLVIEPFVKYPFLGSGTQDIKFGAGGVNLKLNFEPSSKSSPK